jgi:DNA-binding HxlR family transcriptional regulator
VSVDSFGRACPISRQLRTQPLGFRDLRRVHPSISSSVLSTRLRKLTSTEVVQTTDAGKYALTPIGTELLYALAPLKAWSHSWARHLGVEEFTLGSPSERDGLL